jgi:hypothetical protein
LRKALLILDTTFRKYLKNIWTYKENIEKEKRKKDIKIKFDL